MRRAIRVPAVIEPLTGGEAIVSAPADGRFMAATLPSVGDACRPARSSAHPAALERGRRRPRHARRRPWPRRRRRSKPRARIWRAPSGCSPSARCRRGASRRRSALLTVAEARLDGGAGAAGAARRDAAHRRRGAARELVRAARADRRRVAEVFAALGASYDEGAPLFRIVRTDASSCRRTCRPPTRRFGEPSTEIALEIPGAPDPLVVDADHMHDAGVIDPQTRALPVQFDVDNRAGQLLIGQTATAILYTGQRAADADRAEGGRADGGRPPVRVRADAAARASRGASSRSPRATAISSASAAACKPGERVVTRGAYDVQLASAASGLPAEGHVH